MLYYEAEKVITKYANELLPKFADHWQRFPQGGNAWDIIEALSKKVEFYHNLAEKTGDTDYRKIYDDLANVCGEIRDRME